MIVRAIARRKRLISLVALVAVVSVGVFFAARPVGDWLLTRYYRQRLEVVEGREAHVLLDQAADLGEPGIAVLVAGLGSSKESVSRAAGEVIERRMEQWKSLRTRYSSPLLARLALKLSDSIEQFDTAAGAKAARYAEEILARRLDRYAVDRCQVILACQKVIRAAAQTAAASPQVPRTSAPATARGNIGVTTVPVAQLAALPGGGLPKTAQPVLDAGRLNEQMLRLTNRFDPRDLEEPLPSAQIQAERAVEDEPRWFNVPTAARPLGAARDVMRLSNPPNAALRLPDDQDAKHREFAALNPSHPSPGTAFQRAGSPRLSEAKTADLLRRFNGGDAPTAAAARNELQLRGFTDLHFRVAAKLFHPHAAVRARLARELLNVPGLNPQPWLLVLAHDSNSDVRLTAITLLATSADPSILAEVESVARGDADHRIRQQARRMAERRIRR